MADVVIGWLYEDRPLSPDHADAFEEPLKLVIAREGYKRFDLADMEGGGWREDLAGADAAIAAEDERAARLHGEFDGQGLAAGL